MQNLKNKRNKDIVKQPEPIKAGGPVTKKNVENHISVNNNPEIKKLEKIRKQLDNPKYISDIIKNKTFGTEKKEDDSKMTASSGPVTNDVVKQETENDIKTVNNN